LEAVMQIVELAAGVTACLRPDEGANVGLIHTADGEVLVDTTSCPVDIEALLDAVGVSPADVALVINTHSHSDHTWGNQLFDCPILAHERCLAAMTANLDGAWRLDTIRAQIAARGEREPQWAAEMRHKIEGLRITLPTEIITDRRELEVGGVRLRVVHMDAHSPGLCVVWLPDAGVLYASDLIFQGRYPFIGDADLPSLITTLGRLPEFGARAIVPGHGVLCGTEVIEALRSYYEETWARTIDHLTQGHSVEEAVADPGYPHYAEGAAERYHKTNIRLVYQGLVGGEACPL
jgi:cyclase